VSRRGRGEGTIHKRKDGRWAAAADLGYKDGKRYRPEFYGRTRAEVAAKLAEAQENHRAGRPVRVKRQTVEQFLEDWLANTVPTSVRPTTLVSYTTIVRRHIIPELGHLQLADLAPQHVQTMIGTKLAAGLSPRRVQYIRAVLRTALKQAVKWRSVTLNAAALAEAPRVERHEIQPFSVEDARRLLEASQDDRLAALYSVALAMGLRQGEALGLRWEDVAFETGQLRVRVTLQRIDRSYRLLPPKTERSRRTLRMPATALAALRAHRARQLEERLQAGAAWEDWGLVFTTATGRPLHATWITHRFQKLLERSGLPRARFHDLRHTCASLLLAQGVSARMIMEILGHSQISLTMNLYSHIMPSMQEDAAQKMDAALGF
jgi:integrase